MSPRKAGVRMVAGDLASLSALGRCLTAARDNRVVSPEQFGQAARALAVAMLTGSIEMEAYAGIHWVLGQLLEAAFANPAKGKGEDLDSHVETVGRMWNYVGPSGEPLAAVDRFLKKALDMEKARFERRCLILAPLKATPAEVGRLLRASGIQVLSSEGAELENPRFASLAEVCEEEEGMRYTIGWGERRLCLVFSE